MRVLADVGGTNARFAISGPAGTGPVTRFRVSDFDKFEDALAAFLANEQTVPDDVVIAAAGPREGEVIKLTNADWRIAASSVSDAAEGAAVVLLNDLEAVALALPHLGESQIERIGGAISDGPMLAFNVGTGLGAAVAIPGGASWRALSTEAGHMRFAPVTEHERALVGSVMTYEDVLSGDGWRMLEAQVPDPTKRRLLFSGLLGRVAGDLVLATGAWGGVYFCGGVLDDWDDKVDAAAFDGAFEDKGPMTARMTVTPRLRILDPSPALVGLAHAEI